MNGFGNEAAYGVRCADSLTGAELAHGTVLEGGGTGRSIVLCDTAASHTLTHSHIKTNGKLNANPWTPLSVGMCNSDQVLGRDSDDRS